MSTYPIFYFKWINWFYRIHIDFLIFFNVFEFFSKSWKLYVTLEIFKINFLSDWTNNFTVIALTFFQKRYFQKRKKIEESFHMKKMIGYLIIYRTIVSLQNF